MAKPDFWQDQSSAKRISQERDELHSELLQWEAVVEQVGELAELAQVAERENDHELLKEIEKQFDAAKKQFAAIELSLFFSGTHDQSDAYVTIHAGTGGTDAMDWAGMLLRMYMRFCEQQRWTVTLLEEQRGKEAGVKRAMLSVSGRHAFGMLKAEAGVHRLVRISPFDAEKMRHTSFALVEVIPQFDDIDDITLDEKDIRIETSTASGHGGQSVNTTYSAVRIVHVPTGITVSCQNERSQTQNKETALKILKSKLRMLAEAERQKEEKEIRGEYKSAEWGNQIRSYVLHPYTLVKDHRTKHETQDVYAVLDGKLMPFIESYLRFSARR